MIHSTGVSQWVWPTSNLKRGNAPDWVGMARRIARLRARSESEQDEETDLEESIFAFSKAPEEQIGRVAKAAPPARKSGSNNRKTEIGARRDFIRWERSQLRCRGKSWARRGNRRHAIHAQDPQLLARFPDREWQTGFTQRSAEQSCGPGDNSRQGCSRCRNRDESTRRCWNAGYGWAADDACARGTGANHLALFIADDGAITYEMTSRKTGKSSGKIELNKPLPTGWADWQLNIDKVMPHARAVGRLHACEIWASTTSPAVADLPDGVHVRLQQNGETSSNGCRLAGKITVPTSPKQTFIAYGWEIVSLPIALELLDFEVKRNEGNDSPAGFKSNLRVVTAKGESATGSCWMNNPFSFPGQWWRTCTGLTYKISQASWNPENLGQSTVQILRDPGWLLKWVGSLLVVVGVFMMFYLQPYRKQTEGEPITLPGPGAEEPDVSLVPAER